MAEAQEKDQTYLEEKIIGKLNGLRFNLLRTNQPSSKKLVQSFSAIMILSAAHLFFIFLVEMGAASKNRMFESEIQRYHWYALVRNFNYLFLPL